MRYSKQLCLFIIINIFLFLANDAMAAHQPKPAIIAFTRHTFRGPTNMTPPPVPKVSNLKIQNPILAYEMDATIPGLQITEQFGEKYYNHAARLALKAIRENPALAGHWTNIRPDMATQRTFWTAVRLNQGLAKISHREINMNGCPAEEHVGVDVVSSHAKSQMQCLASISLTSQHDVTQSQIASHYISLANRLITLLGGKPNVTLQNPYQSFSDIRLLSKLIEFNSDLTHFSLHRIVTNPVKTTPAINRETVFTALKIMGYALWMDDAGLKADVSSLPKIKYIDALPSGAQEIILTHDDDISALLQSLDLISAQSNANDLAIYPLETLTIALNQKNVAIVRTRINLGPNGSMTGKSGFKSRIVWSGSRQDWNALTTALQHRMDHYPSVANCLNHIKICEPVPLHLSRSFALRAHSFL